MTTALVSLDWLDAGPLPSAVSPTRYRLVNVTQGKCFPPVARRLRTLSRQQIPTSSYRSSESAEARKVGEFSIVDPLFSEKGLQ